MTIRTASCSCGQLFAVASGEPVRISICHCLACQRRTGSVFGSQARFGRATVHYEIAGLEDYIAIPVGAFADSSFPAPTISVYDSRKHAWVTVPHDAEHMA